MRSLDEFKGHPIFVTIWATWCPTCLQELVMLERVHRRYQKDGLVVVAIAIEDTLPRVTKYTRDAHITFPVLVDSQGEIKRMFDVAALPITFAIGRDGSRTKLLDPGSTDAFFDQIEGPREWDKVDARKSLETLIKQP